MKKTLIDVMDDYKAHIDYLQEELIDYMGSVNCEDIDSNFIKAVKTEMGIYLKVVNDLEKTI